MFALNIHLYKNSDDLSPVKTLPVLVAPCAAGARPTNNILALISPKPVIGFPQYFWSMNCFLFFLTIFFLNSISLEHLLQFIIFLFKANTSAFI